MGRQKERERRKRERGRDRVKKIYKQKEKNVRYERDGETQERGNSKHGLDAELKK